MPQSGRKLSVFILRRISLYKQTVGSWWDWLEKLTVLPAREGGVFSLSGVPGIPVLVGCKRKQQLCFSSCMLSTTVCRLYTVYTIILADSKRIEDASMTLHHQEPVSNFVFCTVFLKISCGQWQTTECTISLVQFCAFIVSASTCVFWFGSIEKQRKLCYISLELQWYTRASNQTNTFQISILCVHFGFHSRELSPSVTHVILHYTFLHPSGHLQYGIHLKTGLCCNQTCH